MNKVYYIDAGHGGMLGGVYTTSPRKMHRHKTETAYEGLINRGIGESFHTALRHRGFKSIYLDAAIDIPLKTRVKIVNDLFSKYPNLVLICIHSNASPSHGARGFEVWTSEGETKSDPIATIFGEQLIEDFPDIKFRADRYNPNEEKKDLDKEKDFTVIAETDCPAILIENLFFDQWDDFQLLKRSTFIWRLVNSYMQAVEKLEKSTL